MFVLIGNKTLQNESTAVGGLKPVTTKLATENKQQQKQKTPEIGEGEDDADLRRVLSWTPYKNSEEREASLGTRRGEDDAIIVPCDCRSEALGREEAERLRGHIIVVEGGVGQGKSLLTTTMSSLLNSFGVNCRLEREPVDQEALALFIKFQKLPDSSSVGSKRMEELKEAKIRASEMMQFNMMRNRSECAMRVALTAEEGGVGIMDRGPFGDAAFMNTTFSQAGVSPDLAMQYIIEFMRRYIRLGFPGKNMIILRLRAPPEVALTRWLDRERETKGNKYTLEYVKSLEAAHDMCGVAWGRHFVYDNTPSPEPGTAGYIAAVNGLLKTICSNLTD